ncbi:YdeI/OmpD-associated family protein [Microbacterium sp. NPDC089318]
MPDVLTTALQADPVARAAFEGLSFTRRKEIARSIAEAKQDATRQRRLEKVLAELRTAL